MRTDSVQLDAGPSPPTPRNVSPLNRRGPGNLDGTAMSRAMLGITGRQPVGQIGKVVRRLPRHGGPTVTFRVSGATSMRAATPPGHRTSTARGSPERPRICTGSSCEPVPDPALTSRAGPIPLAYTTRRTAPIP